MKAKSILHLAFFSALFTASAAVLSAPETAVKAPDKAQAAQADELDTTAAPHVVVENVTDALMKLVDNNQEALEQNPEQFYSEVRDIMEKAVDFQWIARNVMGAKYWKSATEDQQARFVEVFTKGLVETYAKGMANFAEFDISVQEPDADAIRKNKAEVIQKFQGPKGVNRVAYTMGKHKSGEWKLLNVVIDGVNLGQTLRAQFSQSVKENEGDLEKAIRGWTLKA